MEVDLGHSSSQPVWCTTPYKDKLCVLNMTSSVDLVIQVIREQGRQSNLHNDLDSWRCKLSQRLKLVFPHPVKIVVKAKRTTGIDLLTL